MPTPARRPTIEAMISEPCLVCDGQPRVLVMMRHTAMLRFTREMLERECGCWVSTEAGTGQALAAALDRFAPDLLVIDAADFPACCFTALAPIARGRVIVIGPEPDRAYRQAAMSNGAGGWLARDHVASELSSELRSVLGCRHDSGDGAVRHSSRDAATAPGHDGAVVSRRGTSDGRAHGAGSDVPAAPVWRTAEVHGGSSPSIDRMPARGG